VLDHGIPWRDWAAGRVWGEEGGVWNCAREVAAVERDRSIEWCVWGSMFRSVSERVVA